MKNEEIELEHIQLELQNGRSQHLRHFVDQYYCYSKGYVNKNGNAKWELIFWKEWVSKKAENKTDKKLVVKEHIVPLKFITEELKKLKRDCSINEIKFIIDKYLHFGTITKKEDTLLSSLGFKQKMPKEFYDKEHELFGNVFSRYLVAGIEFKKAE